MSHHQPRVRKPIRVPLSTVSLHSWLGNHLGNSSMDIYGWCLQHLKGEDTRTQRGICIATSKKTGKATAARSEGAVPNKAAFTRRNLCYACHLASNLILQILQTVRPQTSVNIYKHRQNIYNHWLLWHCVPYLIKLVHLSIVVEELLERDKVHVDTPPQTQLGKVLLQKETYLADCSSMFELHYSKLLHIKTPQHCNIFRLALISRWH